MKIFDMRLRPPFGSIARGMFGNPGRELFEPEAFAPRFGMTIAESARLCSMELFIREMWRRDMRRRGADPQIYRHG